jgi:hypothetical protein
MNPLATGYVVEAAATAEAAQDHRPTVGRPGVLDRHTLCAALGVWRLVLYPRPWVACVARPERH